MYIFKFIEKNIVEIQELYNRTFPNGAPCDVRPHTSSRTARIDRTPPPTSCSPDTYARSVPIFAAPASRRPSAPRRTRIQKINNIIIIIINRHTRNAAAAAPRHIPRTCQLL